MARGDDGMQLERDDAKDAGNRAKRGVSLAQAAGLDWANAARSLDRRGDYGEARFVAHARLGTRPHVCVYTFRKGGRRIISLRKANARGIGRYEQAQSPDE